eukprot:gb/GEZJ01004123.1/.p1 GENE.gb/GEZJ01004123.1/~~gb/GEZJ01004123.1/.p1  ORF type:complete len:261 (-),score=23.17 gb/GEZJ01004123.1/:182-964(-)
MNAYSRFYGLLVLLLVSQYLNHVTFAEPVTATAVIHEDDGTWGSVVFHQWTRTSPVVISMLFRNLKIYDKFPVNYQLWDEPVHYDWYSRQERCGSKALKTMMNVNGSEVGDLGMRHRLMTSDRFAEVVYDKKLSLYEGVKRSIIGKTFVIKQGADESSYSCATIYASRLHSQRPGAIPCEIKQYSDCVVGTAEDGMCTLKSCYGYRQYWGVIDEKTEMCAQIRDMYPKRLERSGETNGVFSCKYGNHTLLRPIDSKAHLL